MNGELKIRILEFSNTQIHFGGTVYKKRIVILFPN